VPRLVCDVLLSNFSFLSWPCGLSDHSLVYSARISSIKKEKSWLDYKIQVSFQELSRNLTEIELYYSPDIESAVVDLVIEARKKFRIPAGSEPAPSETELTSKAVLKPGRERGPSSWTLDACKKGLGYWLDNNKPLSAAADLAGIDKATLQRWIPNVLDTLDSETRTSWITKLRALNKSKYLGKYRED